MNRRVFLQLAPMAGASALAATTGNSARAFKQPCLAAHQGEVLLAAGRPEAILIATAEGMKTLAEIPTPGKIMVGRNRGPRLVSAGQRLVVSAIVNDHPPVHGAHQAGQPMKPAVPDTSTGNLLAWTSRDNGKSWSRPVVVNDAPGAAREGLHGMAASGNRVIAAWLDLRGNGTKLYLAQSADGGLTWGKNQALYESPTGTICQCCHPSVAMNAAGQVAVMFRNALEGHRDMYLMHSRDGEVFDEATKLGTGTWALDICPMDGGGLQLDARGQATAIWQRAKKIYLTTPQQPEVELGEGLHPALSRSTLAWESGKTIYVKRGARAAESLVEGSYPRLMTAGNGIYCAYDTADGFAIQPV